MAMINRRVLSAALLLILRQRRRRLKDQQKRNRRLLIDYYLHNLIKVSTCEMQRSSTSLDPILTNRRYKFKHTHAFETGLSDFHKIVTTCFKNAKNFCLVCC